MNEQTLLRVQQIEQRAFLLIPIVAAGHIALDISNIV